MDQHSIHLINKAAFAAFLYMALWYYANLTYTGATTYAS